MLSGLSDLTPEERKQKAKRRLHEDGDGGTNCCTVCRENFYEEFYKEEDRLEKMDIAEHEADLRSRQ